MKGLHLSKKIIIILMIIVDAVIVTISSMLALLMRFDISAFSMIPQKYLMGALINLPVCIVIAIVILALFRLYNRVWTYASMNELYALFLATIVIEVIQVLSFVVRGISMPRSYYLLTFIAMFVLFSIERFSKRILFFLKNRYGKNDQRICRVMVIGAGSAGDVLIRDMIAEGGASQAVCVIDDNPNKLRKIIHGVPVVGDRTKIREAAQKYAVDEIVIAMPSVDPVEIKDIIERCNDAERPVKILPSVAKSMTSSLAAEVRPVSYEDLLGRDPVVVNQEGISDFIKGKTVLVTGGGGSIGSELCRQIVKYHPKKLLIFDIYENNAYNIEMELNRHYPLISISNLIGSVRDYDRLEAVFQKYHPDIVYHAAAHKHVPLMEKSPNEAVKNNCLGTWNAVRLAEKYEAEHFILISTDKAVRPTNVMGATKRICEMIIQTYAKHASNTRFAAVRFGNVLGSNGSVIPLFLKQIEEGGPVTVTHREITRFFMTIPEAVSLILQATLFAKGGEIFVLDMGKPVKIYDLAENLIRLQGFKPHEDIAIDIVGLRPGEKLYEEILMDEEGLSETENHLIHIGKPLVIDEDSFLHNLEDLIQESMKNGRQIKEKVEEVCGTYTITDNE